MIENSGKQHKETAGRETGLRTRAGSGRQVQNYQIGLISLANYSLHGTGLLQCSGSVQIHKTAEMSLFAILSDKNPFASK